MGELAAVYLFGKRGEQLNRAEPILRSLVIAVWCEESCSNWKQEAEQEEEKKTFQSFAVFHNFTLLKIKTMKTLPVAMEILRKWAIRAY